MRRRTAVRGALLPAALLLVAAPAASAQVTTLAPLRFGTIVAGARSSVAPAAAGAGAWRIRGILSVSTLITFTLPTTLARVGGGATMPVTFCSTCAAFRVNNPNPVGAPSFNPSTGLQGIIVVVISDVYVWLGGAVDPPLGQQPGSYVGTAVLTIAHLL